MTITTATVCGNIMHHNPFGVANPFRVACVGDPSLCDETDARDDLQSRQHADQAVSETTAPQSAPNGFMLAEQIGAEIERIGREIVECRDIVVQAEAVDMAIARLEATYDRQRQLWAEFDRERRNPDPPPAPMALEAYRLQKMQITASATLARSRLPALERRDAELRQQLRNISAASQRRNADAAVSCFQARVESMLPTMTALSEEARSLRMQYPWRSADITSLCRALIAEFHR